MDRSWINRAENGVHVGSTAIAATVITDIAVAVTVFGWLTGLMVAKDESVERLVAALVEIEAGAAENVDRSKEIQRRAKFLRKRLEAGGDLIELVQNEEPPRVVELITANMATLETAGAELRAAQALALRAEGLTIEAIAELFGVTRQRISALLKQKAALEQ